MIEHYIGIDLHKAFFQACAVNAAGARVWEDRFPRTEAGIAGLLARCDRRAAVAVEASTPTWHFADAVGDHVGNLRIVDPMKTKLKAGYAAKTDRLDARRLADALRRDSVVGIYYPPIAIRELRELCRYRHAVVQVRTALVNRLRAVLLRQGIVDGRRLARTPSDAWLEALTMPPRAAHSITGLRRLLTGRPRGSDVRRSRGLGRSRGRSDRAAAASDSRPRTGAVADGPRGDRRARPLSDARPSGELRRSGAQRRCQRATDSLWPDYATRVAVAPLGLGRSRYP